MVSGNLSSLQAQKMSYWSIRSFCVDNLACLNIQFHKLKYHMLCAAAYMGEEEVEKNKRKMVPTYL